MEPIMSRRAIIINVILGWAMLIVCGCNDAIKRQEITGEVKFQGQPIAEGIINFAPMDGQATGDGAQIINGKYRIPLDKGLSPGKYRISIYAGNGTSGQGDASPDAPNRGPIAAKERIPPEYNENSTLIRDVTKSGPNNFDFDIP
jgi:hypothetical protein